MFPAEHSGWNQLGRVGVVGIKNVRSDHLLTSASESYTLRDKVCIALANELGAVRGRGRGVEIMLQLLT
jgi:hypothetical protein